MGHVKEIVIEFYSRVFADKEDTEFVQAFTSKGEKEQHIEAQVAYQPN